METELMNKEIDLMQYWNLLVKRKWIIIAFIGFALLYSIITSFFATPIYMATTSLLIEEESSRVLSVEDEFGVSRRVTDMRFFDTQLSLLQSRSLAERVSRKMNLLRREEFGANQTPKRSIISSIKYVLTFQWIPKKKDSEDEDSGVRIRMNPHSSIARSIVGGLEIEPVRNTRLVYLSYKSPYPNLAAELVNNLAQEYINFSIEKRSGITKERLDFLEEQIAILRDELNAKNRELQRYSLEKDIVELSQSDNPAIADYEEVHTEHNQAKFERIRAYTTYTTLKDLENVEVDSLSHITANALIQQLQTDYARLRAEYEEKRRIYGLSHPEMKRIQSGLDNLAVEIKTELTKAIAAAERNYRQALNQENRLKSELDSQMTNVARTGSAEVQYSLLRIEIDSITSQIDFFVKQRDEASVSINLEGLKIGNLSVIDPAEVPFSPISPKKKRNLIMALFVGLFGGVGLCFLLDYLDNTVKGPEDIERLSGLPSLGVIPYLPPEGMTKKGGGYFSKYRDYYSYGDEVLVKEEDLEKIKNIELINFHHPRFFISEDYRTLRTSILLSNSHKPPKSFLVSSALPGEGKTATAANLAVAFSQLAEKVLIVDADLRKPRVHRVFRVKNVEGLSNYLTGKITLKESIKMSSIDNIWVMPSGPIPPNPAELLNSTKMQTTLKELEKEFDVVILDTPPVLAAIDTVVLSSIVDGIVYVLHAGKTVEKAYIRAIEEFNKSKSSIIGVVLNEVKLEQGKYYYKNYYHGGAYSQNED